MFDLSSSSLAVYPCYHKHKENLLSLAAVELAGGCQIKLLQSHVHANNDDDDNGTMTQISHFASHLWQHTWLKNWSLQVCQFRAKCKQVEEKENLNFELVLGSQYPCDKVG